MRICIPAEVRGVRGDGAIQAVTLEDTTSGETFEVVNPATEEVVASVPAASADDIELAVATAKRAFAEWSRTDTEARAAILAKAAELIHEFAVGRTLEATLEELIHTIHAHPTLSEAALEATLAALGQAIHI